MATIRFATWDGGGNLPPALGLATELAGRGHDVGVLGHRAQEAAVTAAGLPFTPYATAGDFSALAVNSLPAMIGLFGSRDIGADLLAEDADLLVVDCLLFGAMDAARRARRRYVVLEHLFDGYLRGPWLHGPLGVGMWMKRLRPKAALDGAARCVAATLPELDRRRAPAANLVHTGPVATGTPAVPDRPTVLISLSTYRYPGMEGVLQRVLDGVAGLPARTIVTTGPLAYPDLRVPDGVEVRGYVPHAELLPRTSLVVGHGGHATTMAALAHDVPLLIVPMHPLLDQPLVARAVQEAGAGRRLPKGAAPSRIREAVQALVGAGPHRAAAARLGAAIRGMDGARRGADVIEDAARAACAPAVAAPS